MNILIKNIKKILILKLLILSSFCYSQIDTTKMEFPTRIVREISKELVQKDGLEKENILLYNKIDLLNRESNKKDSLIFISNKEKNNLNLIIEEKNYQIEIVKKETKIYKQIAGGSLLLLLVSLIL